MIRQLAALHALACLVRDAELARLSAAAADRRRHEQAFADLRAARSAALAQSAPDPAHLCGADQRWQDWGTPRLRALSTRMADSAAATEAQLKKAQRAFSRSEALARLAERARSGR